MTTERLFEFLVLSQTLSYSKASKKLFITQSALSRHIIEMEKELGVTLLDRTTHGVGLTPAGRILAGRAQRLIQKSESAVSRLRVAGIRTTGSVSIACLESVVYDQLVIFLTHFASKFGEVDLKVDVINTPDRAAVLERYDFTFTAFELPNLPGYIEPRLAFRSPAVLMALLGNELMQSHNIGLEDLAGKTLLVPYADEMFCSYALNRQLAEKLTGYSVNVVKVPTVESALMMVALGKGFAIVPDHLAQNTVANIWSLDITTPGCVFDTYLYWNQSRANPAAKLMMEEFASFTNAKG